MEQRLVIPVRTLRPDHGMLHMENNERKVQELMLGMDRPASLEGGEDCSESSKGSVRPRSIGVLSWHAKA